MAKKRVIDDEFSKKIALIAKEKFGSQKALAEAIGVSASNVSDWTKGKIMPSLTVLKELCLKAEISLDWLVLDKDMSNEIDHHEFARIVVYAHEWAKSNKIESNDDLLTSIYLTFEDRRKEKPTLTIKQFLDEFGEIYKNIKFNQ